MAPPSAHSPIMLTRDQSRRVDQLAIDELEIPGIVLMENAAASLERAGLDQILRHALSRVVIVCGPGNNGGDGLALARRLCVASEVEALEIEVILSSGRERYKGDALTNFHIAEAMNLVPSDPDIESILESLSEVELTHPRHARQTLVVDAILGTGATRSPEGAIADHVRWINRAKAAGARVLAVDVPTGLDCDTGAPLGDDELVVRADMTMTLCAMKVGLARDEAKVYSGGVLVGEIGVPSELIERCARE